MELGVPALREQEQQVQTRHLVPVILVGAALGMVGELVEGLQLRHVAGEGLGVLGADAEEGAGFVDLPCEGEMCGWCGGGGRHGLELEQADLGLGEKFRCLAVGGVWMGFELRENLLERALGHGSGGWWW